MLTLSQVTEQYGNVTVLRDIDLAVPKGRATVIIGVSGCGKSTLIRLANGLILPDRGTVEFMGTAITAATTLALRRHMGYVIQEGGLFPHLTGRAMWLSCHGGSAGPPPGLMPACSSWRIWFAFRRKHWTAIRPNFREASVSGWP